MADDSETPRTLIKRVINAGQTNDKNSAAARRRSTRKSTTTETPAPQPASLRRSKRLRTPVASAIANEQKKSSRRSKTPSIAKGQSTSIAGTPLIGKDLERKQRPGGDELIPTQSVLSSQQSAMSGLVDGDLVTPRTTLRSVIGELAADGNLRQERGSVISGDAFVGAKRGTDSVNRDGKRIPGVGSGMEKATPRTMIRNVLDAGALPEVNITRQSVTTGFELGVNVDENRERMDPERNVPGEVVENAMDLEMADEMILRIDNGDEYDIVANDENDLPSSPREGTSPNKANADIAPVEERDAQSDDEDAVLQFDDIVNQKQSVTPKRVDSVKRKTTTRKPPADKLPLYIGKNLPFSRFAKCLWQRTALLFSSLLLKSFLSKCVETWQHMWPIHLESQL